MKFIRDFVKWFVIINTGVLLIFALNTIGYDYIKTVYLLEIFAASAVTALLTAMFMSIEPKKVINKYMQFLLVLAHYVCLLVTMIILGKSFGWITTEGKDLVFMALSVAGVYICTAIIAAVLGTREAKMLNDALQSFKE